MPSLARAATMKLLIASILTLLTIASAYSQQLGLHQPETYHHEDLFRGTHAPDQSVSGFVPLVSVRYPHSSRGRHPDTLASADQWQNLKRSRGKAGPRTQQDPTATSTTTTPTHEANSYEQVQIIPQQEPQQQREHNHQQQQQEHPPQQEQEQYQPKQEPHQQQSSSLSQDSHPVLTLMPSNTQSNVQPSDAWMKGSTGEKALDMPHGQNPVLWSESDDDLITPQKVDSRNETSKFYLDGDYKGRRSNIHPLLIYTTRNEIRAYDLYNPFSPVAPSYMKPQIRQQIQADDSDDFKRYLHHMHQLAANNKPTKTLIAGLKNTIGLDFYYNETESYIFWTDVIEERIYRGTIHNGTITNVEMIVQSGLATAEGLAVDWVGLNIYWVESTLDHIEVANLNGSFRRTLIAGDMENPRAISVDPRYGYLFWTDWDKKSPRIERATMAGEKRQVIVQIKEVGGGWPNGLTLDYDNHIIYWIDANSDSLHSLNYDGSDHKTLLENSKSLGHPFAITLFGHYLYWTDWKTNTVSMVEKFSGIRPVELQRLSARMFDIKVFHPDRQPRVGNELNPCFVNNGDCTHLCLLSYNHTRKCQCPHLMKIGPDQKTCEPSERVLLIGKTNEIRAVDIYEPLNHIMAPIGVPKVFHPKQFEYEAKSKSIFWVDYQTNEVKRIQLGGVNIDTIIDVIIESPSGLALDWISGNIYVTSSPQQRSSGKIFISNLNGEYISVVMDRLIAPKSIAVHPILGLIFCVDEEENGDPIVFLASMDGRNKRVISSKSLNPKLNNPTSLAIDFELRRVYWINQANSTSSIQYYDIEKEKVFTFLDETSLHPSERINPSVLCIDGDDLLIGSVRATTETITRISKQDSNQRVVLKAPPMDQISALRVYNVSTQIGTNACSLNNGNCSQLCVPTDYLIHPEQQINQRICKCTMGYTINPNNETECVGKDLFLIFSYNLGMKGISIDPTSSVDDYYLPPIHRAFRASSIDFIYKDSLIYWVDNEEGSITRINRDTTNYQLIVQGLESEESIALDWVAGNIYWIDPYYDIIEVARLDGSNRYVIVSGDMDKANGIVVNPLSGYIVWSDIGSSPKIETAKLDGSDRRIVVGVNVAHIDDIAIDYSEDYIYWVDSTLAIIERVKENGSGRQIVYSSAGSILDNIGSSNTVTRHLVSIAVYKEHLYIADSMHQGAIIRCDKIDGSNRQVIQQHLGEGIRDIAIYAKQPMPSTDVNPCIMNNGGCQDLCLFLGEIGQKRCICSHGKLNSDGLTCKPYDTFILFSRLSQIDSLHIKDSETFNNSPYPPIMIENKSTIISLTVDYSSRRVIYSDISRDQICSVHFNGTDRRVLVEKQTFVEGIAFANNQLYWTSINDMSISRLNTTSLGVLQRSCSGDGSLCKTAGVEKLIKLSYEDKPRGIAVDKCTSYIYWTNWNNNAAIQRASPNNGYQVESIIKTNIKVPNGIAIDQIGRKLYWCDARLDKIEVCDMDGRNRVILLSAAPQHPFALAVWDNYVFWTDWLARSVFKADKYTGSNPTLMKKVAQRPMGIAVAAPMNDICPNDLCAINNGGCPPDHSCSVSNPKQEVTCHRSISMRKLPCKSGSCDRSDTISIIRDSMERYNLADIPRDIMPTEPETYKSNMTEMNGTSTSPSMTTTNTTITTTTTTTIAPMTNATILEAQNNTNFPFSTTTTLKPVTEVIVVQNNHPTGSLDSPVIDRSAKSEIPQDIEPHQSVIMTNTTYTPVRGSVSTTRAPKASTITSTELPQIEAKEKNSSKSPTTTTTTTSTTTTTTSPQSRNTTISDCPCQTSTANQQTTTTDIATTLADSASSQECKPHEEYKCYLSDGLVCITIHQRCDSKFDCPKKEDEIDCLWGKNAPYQLTHETNWYRFIPGILIIMLAAVAALFLVFGPRGRRRWFVGANGAFGHRRMFDDNGTNIEISNPMFDEDDSGNLVHCAFSIDLNERTTNFSNPLYERQVLLMSDKPVTSN